MYAGTSLHDRIGEILIGGTLVATVRAILPVLLPATSRLKLPYSRSLARSLVMSQPSLCRNVYMRVYVSMCTFKPRSVGHNRSLANTQSQET